MSKQIYLKPLDAHTFIIEAEQIREKLWPVYVAGNKAESDIRQAQNNAYRAYYALKELILFNELRERYANFSYRYETTKRFTVNGTEVTL